MEPDSAAPIEGRIPLDLEQEIRTTLFSNDLELRLIDALESIKNNFGPISTYKEIERLITDIRTPPASIDTRNNNLHEFLRRYLWDLFPTLVRLLDEDPDFSCKEVTDSITGCLKRVLDVKDSKVREEAVAAAIILAKEFSENGFPEETFVLASMALRAAEHFPDKEKEAAYLSGCARVGIMGIAHGALDDAEAETNCYHKAKCIANALDTLLRATSLRMSIDYEEITVFLQHPDTINMQPAKCAELLLDIHPEDPDACFLEIVNRVIEKLGTDDSNKDATSLASALKGKFLSGEPPRAHLPLPAPRI